MIAMAVFGWACIGAGLLFFSLAWMMVAFNTLGQYNIGGVPNDLGTKMVTIVYAAALITFWYLWIEIAPFTISIVKV